MNPKRESRVLFVASDPGGCLALAPVYRAMKRKRGSHAVGLFSSVSRPLQVGRLPFVDAATFTADRMEQAFDHWHPSLVVVGTGHGFGLDKMALAVAKARTISTMAILDYWNAYAARFSHPGTEDFVFLTDIVCVMDPMAAKELHRAGVPKNRIVVTGNPHLEEVASGLGGRRPSVIAFLCQPFSELENETGMPYPYLETDALNDIVETLNATHESRTLVVKFHPRTKRFRKFDTILSRASFPVALEQAGPVRTLFRRSALILGMNSMALFEAALAGIPVISYQPGIQRKDDLLVSNRLGLTRSAYHKRDLAKFIQSPIHVRSLRALERLYPWHRRATARVLASIESFL